MRTRECCTPVNRSSQTGAILIVGLVFALIISIIALAAMRGSNLQEAMVGNTRDHNIAFQSAEAGTGAAEAQLDQWLVGSVTGFAVATAGSGRFKEPTAANAAVNMSDADFNTKGFTTTAMSLKADSQPVYIIEKLKTFNDAKAEGGQMDTAVGSGSVLSLKDPYRITTKGVGVSPNSTVIVQTHYVRTAD